MERERDRGGGMSTYQGDIYGEREREREREEGEC